MKYYTHGKQNTWPVMTLITCHQSSSVFYQDACRQGRHYSGFRCLRRVAQLEGAHLRAGAAQSYHPEGMEEHCRRGDHLGGMEAVHLDGSLRSE